MAALGNFVWFLFCGGLLTSLLWIIAAGMMAMTVVGIPFAHAALRIASFAAFPFGKQLIDARLLGENRITGTGLMNVCLLYTSPSPRDGLLSRMPSSA